MNAISKEMLIFALITVNERVCHTIKLHKWNS